MRVVVLIGFLGAFTTFSSYVVDTSLLAQSADWIRLFLYVIAQNSIGLFAVLAGATAGKLIW
jgi:CrcB protein